MLSINFTDHKGEIVKTYSAISVKTGMVDKLMEIAEQAELLKIGTPKVSEYRGLLADMKAVIVAIFGDQFTYDELQEGAEQREILRCFDALVDFITESVSKN